MAAVSRARHDVVVAGLGAMGSATAAQLALRGRRVLGLERWTPGHPYGSSHGDSRIIRELYFEHPMYVPLLQRAYALWRELEARTGESLMHLTGGLMIGPEDGALVAGTLRSAREHGLAHERLDAAQLRRRFPAFALRGGDVAVLDPRGGYLEPDRANAAHLALARAHGAELRFDEPVLAWAPDGEGVRVTTPKGTYVAERLCLTVGARTGALLPDLRPPLAVERQVLFWLDPGGSPGSYAPGDFPIWLYEHRPGHLCYGFPRLARGVKASIMHDGDPVADADAVRRAVREDEVEPLRAALRGVLPSLAEAPVREHAVCLFTNAPDADFLIDVHPEHPQVLVSSPCSGHGYKFASAIGEVQADLLVDGGTRFDLTPFRLSRFGPRAAERAAPPGPATPA